MLNKTHMTIGIATTLPFVLTQDLNLVSAILGITAATAPDLDKAFHTAHRGFSHSLLATSGLYFGIKFITDKFIPLDGLAFAIAINYFSHIVADSFTKKGVALFWPYKKMVGLKMFKLTNSRDFLVRIGAYLVILYEIATMTELGKLFF